MPPEHWPSTLPRHPLEQALAEQYAREHNGADTGRAHEYIHRPRVARLIEAQSGLQAWETLDLMPAARDMEQTLRSLQEFAREHAEMYNTYAA